LPGFARLEFRRFSCEMVGVRGFEPPTPASRTQQGPAATTKDH